MRYSHVNAWKLKKTWCISPKAPILLRHFINDRCESWQKTMSMATIVSRSLDCNIVHCNLPDNKFGPPPLLDNLLFFYRAKKVGQSYNVFVQVAVPKFQVADSSWSYVDAVNLCLGHIMINIMIVNILWWYTIIINVVLTWLLIDHWSVSFLFVIILL